MNALSTRRRSELRAEAHKLSPIVIIGDKGLTDEVVAEIDRSLKAHELIKVRATTGEREARDVWLEAICERLAAHPVQQIGKIFVIYRENPKEKAQAPRPKAQEKKDQGTRLRAQDGGPKEGAKRFRAVGPAPSTRTSRRRSPAPSPRPESGPPKRRPRTSR